MKYHSKNKIKVDFNDGHRIDSPGSCNSKTPIDIREEMKWIQFRLMTQINEVDNDSGVKEITIKITLTED